MVIRLNEMAIV